MNTFTDTNILAAAVTADSNRSDQAVRLLNEVENGLTSFLNVLDLRSVLAKKKSVEGAIAWERRSVRPLHPHPCRDVGSSHLTVRAFP